MVLQIVALKTCVPTCAYRNHIMFGSVGDWMYQTLAGIRQAEESFGYKRVEFVPPHSDVLLFSGLFVKESSVCLKGD